MVEVSNGYLISADEISTLTGRAVEIDIGGACGVGRDRLRVDWSAGFGFNGCLVDIHHQ